MPTLGSRLLSSASCAGTGLGLAAQDPLGLVEPVARNVQPEYGRARPPGQAPGDVASFHDNRGTTTDGVWTWTR